MNRDRAEQNGYLDAMVHESRCARGPELDCDRLSVIIDHLAEVILITDAQGRIEYTNPAFTRLTGYDRAEAIGQTPRLLKSGLQTDAFYRTMWDALRSGETWSGRVQNRCKDGRIITQESTISPVMGESGGIRHYVAVQRDVTIEAALENDLRESQRLEALGTLAGGIAHDFNNILYALLGYAHLAQDELDEEEDTYSYLQEIVKAGERATGLVSKMMAFGRRAVSTRTGIKLQDVAAETLALVRASLPATIRIDSELQPDCPEVLADPIQIHQVLLNLCTNAGYAMREAGGVLSVRLEAVTLDERDTRRRSELQPGRWARLRVTDTGTGIESSLIGRLFEPYFTTKAADEGTGLGLSIVHGIIHNHDGDIDVESRPGEGTTFTIHLPVVQTTAPVPPAPVPPCEATGGGRVLVVDDETMIVDVAVRGLTRLGYTVSGMTDGVEAVEVIRRDPYAFDAVVTDQTMPGITGFELAEQVRALRPDLPLILTTGYFSDEGEAKIQQAGFRRLLPKPLKINDLAGALEELLSVPAAN